MSTTTVFTAPGTRAQIIEFFALEKELPLSLRPCGDRTSAAYLKIHPFGKLPAALTSDGTAIFESGAILLYLSDLSSPAANPSKRASLSKWVLWANASLWPAVESARKIPTPMLTGLEAILSTQPFLNGTDFTVADAAVGSYLHYASVFFGEKFPGAPSVTKYLAALRARPHFISTIGNE